MIKKNAGHFKQAAQLNMHGYNHNPSSLYIPYSLFPDHYGNTPSTTPSLFSSVFSDLHAVQCGAGAAHTAGPEAALLRQGPVAQGQQLAAQPQVLPAQPRLKATLGVLSEQLAASADVLSSELWEGRRAVSIVPAEGEEGGGRRRGRGGKQKKQKEKKKEMTWRTQ